MGQEIDGRREPAVREHFRLSVLLSSKPGIGITKPTGLNIVGNCALFKNPKHDQFENFSSLHTFSSGLI